MCAFVPPPPLRIARRSPKMRVKKLAGVLGRAPTRHAHLCPPVSN
jgi:hypothetical protein